MFEMIAPIDKLPCPELFFFFFFFFFFLHFDSAIKKLVESQGNKDRATIMEEVLKEINSDYYSRMVRIAHTFVSSSPRNSD
jgi:hypothetical protein